MSDSNSQNVSEIEVLKSEIQRLKEESQDQKWGIEKTNEGIKILYKEIEKKNKELEKIDQLKSDFVSAVSHELRTPLTVVKESLSQIAEGVFGEVPKEQKTLLDMALDNIDRLGTIIDDLLDISKLEEKKAELNKEEFDMVVLIKEIIRNFSHLLENKDLEVKEDYSNDKIMVSADKGKIIQVYNNLFSNAIKFTDKGYLEVGVSETNGQVECFVADTGLGISDEDLEKVFDKFQQFGRKDGPGVKGTGLGTAICKGIVELHNGEIWAESELEKGTKFIFTLPKGKA